MAQRYTVQEEHTAVLDVLGPTRLLGGQIIDDDAYDVAELLAAGFTLAPQLGPDGDASLVLTPVGWAAGGGGGGVPTSRAIATTAPLTGGGDLSADRTLALVDPGVDGYVLRRAGGVIDWGLISQASVTSLTTDLATLSGAAAAALAAASAAAAAAAASVQPARTIGTTAPLTGGGDLSGNRTLALTIDATLAVVTSALGRAALTGDVTAAAGSNATAIGANKVLDTMLRAGAGTSVIGVAGAAGNVADIAASADGQVLLRAGGALAFSAAIPQASIAGLVTALAALQPLDADLTALAASPATAGLVERTGAAAYTTRLIGAANATDVLTRADGDGRYPLASAVGARIMRPMWVMPTQTSSVISIGSTQCPAWYFGRAEKALTTFDVLLRVAVVMSGTTWCELAIAKGDAPTFNSAATLTVVGYYSTGASGTPFNSTGNKLVTVTLSGGQTVAAGDHLWLVFAKLATGSPSFRSAAAADELVTGQILDPTGSTRPSTILGTPTSFGLASPNPLGLAFYVYV